MTPRAPHPPPVPPTLADQKADFTAEGSPPPGKVATTPPVATTPTTPTAPTAPVVPKVKPDPRHKASKHKQAG